MTKIYDPVLGLEKIIINPDKCQLGRSAYLCRSRSCIDIALKEKKIAKMLRAKVRSIENVISDLVDLEKSLASSAKEVLAKV